MATKKTQTATETKKVTAKKVETPKKVEAKKVAVKKVEAKKVAVKKVAVKKSEAPKNVEAKKVEKITLESRIRDIAVSGKAKGMPSAFTLPRNKENRLLHIDICKKLCALSDANKGYPITYLVYFAIGKNAHRVPTFEKGYTKFNEKKAKTIFSWLRMFAKHNENEKLFRNANLAHALCAFYDQASNKTSDFKAALEKYPKNSKVANFKQVASGLGLTEKGE